MGGGGIAASRLRRAAVALLFAALAGPLAAPAAAQTPEGGRPPGAALTVYLLTIGPGDAVWEQFGHNALWIHDPVSGTDLAYDYGRFSFQQENFLLRFLRGEMRYWMASAPARRLIAHYAAEGRTVWLQRLRLTPAQRAELQAFLRWNALPENRYYRYDYFRDNCSTRVRDALNRVLDGALWAQLADVPTGTTYRSHSRRLTRANLAVSAGIQLGLGQPADEMLSAWEESFLPVQFRNHLRRVRVPRNGEWVPLVASERALFRAPGPGSADEPPTRVLGFLLAGLAVAGLIAGLARLGDRHGAARWALAGFGALWGLLAGLLGTVIFVLWTATEHVFAHQNENLLQMNPLALALVVLVPAAVLGARWARRPARWLALGLAALSLAGFLLQAVPGLDQANGEIIALALPIHLALAWALGRREPFSSSHG